MTEKLDGLIADENFRPLTDYLAAVAKAASLPRLQILYYLDQVEEASAGEIADSIEMDSGTLRHHTKKLVNIGLIRNWEEGARGSGNPYSYYELTDTGQRITRLLVAYIHFEQLDAGLEAPAPATDLEALAEWFGPEQSQVNAEDEDGASLDKTLDTESGVEHMAARAESAEGLDGAELEDLPEEVMDLSLLDLFRELDADEASVLSPEAVPEADSVIQTEIGFEESGELSKKSEEMDIRIIGCGSGGVRMVTEVKKMGAPDAQTIAIDTDRSEVAEGNADSSAVFGKQTFDGKGADGDLKAAREAVERADKQGLIEEAVGDPDLVFIVAGLGKGTGTALAPEVARVAAQTDAVVVSIGTLPFDVERVQSQRAREALTTLSKYSGTLAVLDASYLDGLDGTDGLPSNDQLDRMNVNVARVVANIAEYIGEFRMPERDQTLLTALENGGDSVLLSAVVDSSESYSALSDRLLQYSNVDIREEEVRQAILMFSAGKDIKEKDIADVVDHIQGHVGGVAHTAEYTNQMPPDKLRVTGLITEVNVEMENLLRTKRTPNEEIVENVENVKEDIEILREATATSDAEAAVHTSLAKSEAA